MKQTSPVGIARRMPKPDPDELARRSLKKIKQKFIVMSGKGGAWPGRRRPRVVGGGCGIGR